MKTTFRKTKIIATLGPSSSSEKMITRLMDAGVDVFRLNFSHGSQQEKRALITTIRALSDRKKVAIAILADLQGPKIRTGRMADGAIRLVKGEKLDITTDEVLGRPGLISTIYKALPHDVKPGSKILLDDGMIELKVVSISGNVVHCNIVEGGMLKDLKGINLPGVAVSAPSLSDKDRADLEFCLEMGVDFVALSFVRQASDVEGIKEIIRGKGLNTPVVAKIEKPEALRNFNSILAVTDAVMVARGDLGVELSAERVPLVQKSIIRACNEVGKPVITATQMLESMIVHARPTRAETSDVANAILDGTDAVMLSGETASGAYPIEAVRTMAKIALDIEHAELWRIPAIKQVHSDNVPEAVAEASCHAASTLKAKALVVFTQSGNTAALISKFRPQLPIIAFTPFPEIQRRLALYWGVKSYPVGSVGGTRQQIKVGEETLMTTGFRKGDLVVVSMGVPLEAKGSTNLMKVHRLGTEGYYEIF
ncbi:pyruvate kinase [Geotalea daltonii FRC-32]|uniref:Pyruvate kinase n=2 Tax=Geotalea TaxID=2910589 RepID=B9M7Q0_GEODF|nr:pyruvate kinase [Geotalea daltonii]ACM22156.1 pyruvate kinase [Geotalea daltonii FRC-32]